MIPAWIQIPYLLLIVGIVVAPVVLLYRSERVRGWKKALWVGACILAYYLGPIPAHIYARNLLAGSGPLDFHGFMIASNLEYACIVVAMWSVYLAFRLVTRSANTKDGDAGKAA